MTEQYLKILAAVAPAIVLALVLLRKDRRPEPIRWKLSLDIRLLFLLGFIYIRRYVSRLANSMLTLDKINSKLYL